MNSDQFALALRWFCRRKPFRPFLLEFTSGASFRVTHPEAVDLRGPLFVSRSKDGAYNIFAAESVTRFVDESMDD